LHANFGRFYSCCMRLAAMQVQFSCDWRSFGYNLYATGSHSGTIYMRLAVSHMQTLHALATSCMQSHQYFASMLREQLFKLKNEDAIEKSANLCDWGPLGYKTRDKQTRGVYKAIFTS
jgi:hypothetical protein